MQVLNPCCAGRRPLGQSLLFGGTAIPTAEAVETITLQLYPMFLISVADFLEETTLRPHQHLLREGKLVKHDAHHTGRVIYVSHRTWRTRRTHNSVATSHAAVRLILCALAARCRVVRLGRSGP